jgi:hypothetical protein
VSRDVTLFLAGGHTYVKVCLLQAVKVWPLQGPNPHKFHLSTDSRRDDINGCRALGVPPKE